MSRSPESYHYSPSASRSPSPALSEGSAAEDNHTMLVQRGKDVVTITSPSPANSATIAPLVLSEISPAAAALPAPLNPESPYSRFAQLPTPSRMLGVMTSAMPVLGASPTAAPNTQVFIPVATHLPPSFSEGVISMTRAQSAPTVGEVGEQGCVDTNDSSPGEAVQPLSRSLSAPLTKVLPGSSILVALKTLNGKVDTSASATVAEIINRGPSPSPGTSSPRRCYSPDEYKSEPGNSPREGRG